MSCGYFYILDVLMTYHNDTKQCYVTNNNDSMYACDINNINEEFTLIVDIT